MERVSHVPEIVLIRDFDDLRPLDLAVHRIESERSARVNDPQPQAGVRRQSELTFEAGEMDFQFVGMFK